MSYMNIEMTIERDDVEIEISVELDYQRACRGARGSFGEPLEPDEPENFEITSATDEDGKEVELTESEQQRAIEQAINDLNSAAEDYNED